MNVLYCIQNGNLCARAREWSYNNAVVLLVSRHSSSKEGTAGELIRGLFLTTSPRRRTRSQRKTWTTTIKGDLEPLSGPQVIGYAR